MYPGLPDPARRRQSNPHTRRICFRCYHWGVTSPLCKPLPQQLGTVFLDRDGVLNKKMPEGSYVTSWDSFHPLPGVPEAIARLNQAGLRVVVVSNQRGIALRLYTIADVEAIHSALQRLLSSHGAHIDAFFVCPHQRGRCNCRKPLPGLFEQAVARFPSIAAATCVMIGDSLVDVEFAHRLAMPAILIDSDPSDQSPGKESARDLADLRFAALPQAVDALLKSR